MARIQITAALLCALTVLSTLPQVATAQAVCKQTSSLKRQLTVKYGETRRALGRIGSHRTMDLYAGDTFGTWTLVVNHPVGESCLAAAGEGIRIEPAGSVQAPNTELASYFSGDVDSIREGVTVDACKAADEMRGILADTGTIRRAAGLQRRVGLMELFTHGRTGHWTVTMTIAEDMTCVLLTGTEFRIDPPADPATGPH